MFESMDNEIDECVPGPMVESEPLCSEECSSSGCMRAQCRWAVLPCSQGPGARPAWVRGRRRKGLGLRALSLFLAVQM